MELKTYNITVISKLHNKYFSTVLSTDSNKAIREALSNLPKNVRFTDILKVEVKTI